MISLTCGIFLKINKIHTHTHTHTDTENRLVVTRGEGEWGEDKMDKEGLW